MDKFDRVSIDLNTRYPIDRDFRLSPRLRLDYRWDDSGDGTQLWLRPPVCAVYYLFES
jgi:hypothetical protein